MKQRFITTLSLDENDKDEVENLRKLRYRIIDIFRAGLRSLYIKHQINKEEK